MATQDLDVPIVPHGLTDPKCGGCIVASVQGTMVELRCNECGADVGNIQTAIFRGLIGLDRFEAECPNCGRLNAFADFEQLLSYTCRECGSPIDCEVKPDAEAS